MCLGRQMVPPPRDAAIAVIRRRHCVAVGQFVGSLQEYAHDFDSNGYASARGGSLTKAFLFQQSQTEALLSCHVEPPAYGTVAMRRAPYHPGPSSTAPAHRRCDRTAGQRG